jgi:hypothetical protein
LIFSLKRISEDENATISFVASILPAVADAAIPIPNELNCALAEVATDCPIEIVEFPVPDDTATPVPAMLVVTVFVSVDAIVIVSVVAFVVIVTLLPATKVNVSSLPSATTVDWPDTAIFLNIF